MPAGLINRSARRSHELKSAKVHLCRLAFYPASLAYRGGPVTGGTDGTLRPSGFRDLCGSSSFPYQEHRRNVMSLREESMSNRGGHRGGHRQARTITLPWRKACATIPAVALISGGIALASPAEDLKSAAASKASPALVVPGTALAMPAVPTRTGTQGPPGLVLPAGTVPGSSTPVALDSMGIPSRALEAYRRGASLVGAAD